jgi:NDP-sugar pyrophosphorylase family protein
MPKALVPLAGKPLLQWQVERLRDAGITDIIVNVHHFSDMIIDTIRSNNSWGCNISISDERDELLDTGGGLKKAHKWLIATSQEPTPILACNVDILSNIDLRAFIESYDPSTLGSLVVSPRETQRYLLFDKQNNLCGWTNIKTGEVRPSTLNHFINPSLRKLAFSGMQILSSDALNLLSQMPQNKFSLIDFYMSLCEQNHTPYTIHHTPLKAYIPDAFTMMDVGKIEQINVAERFADMLFNTKNEKK